MNDNDFLKFIEELNKIQTFKGKVDYANQNLQKIGAGRGRVVYEIDDTKVLKLTKNTKGVAQNETEENAARYKDYDDILTNVYDSADDYSWIVAERAKKVSQKRFKELTGFDIWDVYTYVRNFYDENHGHKTFFNIKPEVKEKLDNDEEFVQRITNFISDYGQSTGDLQRPSTYGEVLRDGIPSIVITDYGLSDEVYSTHYDRKRKEKYKIYELFGFGDGNDDILSDIGNTHEVRHGMWAYIPYGAGAGEEIINEGFISFVLDRDKYPTRPLPSMPYVVDQFHECVNNIHEVLDKVDDKDKKKFYNNLLALQEYLTSQNAYDRDLLLKEEYTLFEAEIPEVKPMSGGDKEYGQFLANTFTKKMGLSTPKYLGMGSDGHAFEINENMVLKITSNNAEASNAFKTLRRGPPKYLAEIYKIYKIVDTENNNAFFVILQENIHDKPKEEFDRLENIIDKISPNGLDSFSLIKMLRKRFDANQFTENAKRILTDNPDANVSEEDRKRAYYYMMGLMNIQQELNDFGIKSSDYTNKENLGYKNGVLRYFDVGSIRMEAEPSVADKDIVYLPEDGAAKFSTDGDVGRDGFPTYNQNNISPSIQNNLDANSAMYGEDLEYKHVDDATKDEYALDESDIYVGEKDHKNITNVNVLENVQLINNYINKIKSNEYLSAEDLTDIKFLIFSMKYNKDRYLEYMGFDNYSNAFKLFYLTLKKNNILKEVDKPTKDEYGLEEERKKSWMPGSQAVTVKQKCRLGGKGDGTSVACNQGEIKNLKFKKINETIIPHGKDFWGWVSPEDKLIQVPKLNHKDYIMRQYKDEEFGWDYDKVFDKAMEDGWVRIIYEYFPQQFRGDININGDNKKRVIDVFKKIFYDSVKYGYNVIYLEWENPNREHLAFTTRDMEGKKRMADYMTEQTQFNVHLANQDKSTLTETKDTILAIIQNEIKKLV